MPSKEDNLLQAGDQTNLDLSSVHTVFHAHYVFIYVS